MVRPYDIYFFGVPQGTHGTAIFILQVLMFKIYFYLIGLNHLKIMIDLPTISALSS